MSTAPHRDEDVEELLEDVVEEIGDLEGVDVHDFAPLYAGDQTLEVDLEVLVDREVRG